MAKHPALQMSKVREKVWLEEASDEDYFDMIELLAALYAKKKHRERNKKSKSYVDHQPRSLFIDLEEHQKKRIEAIKNEASDW